MDNTAKDQECVGQCMRGSGGAGVRGRLAGQRGNDECLDVHECRSTPISLI